MTERGPAGVGAELGALLDALESPAPELSGPPSELLGWLDDRQNSVARLSAFRLDVLPDALRASVQDRLAAVLERDRATLVALETELARIASALRDLSRARVAALRYADEGELVTTARSTL